MCTLVWVCAHARAYIHTYITCMPAYAPQRAAGPLLRAVQPHTPAPFEGCRTASFQSEGHAWEGIMRANEADTV